MEIITGIAIGIMGIAAVETVAEKLGIGVGTMYEVAHRADFPSLQLGTKRIVIPRQAFIDWVYRTATKNIT